MWDEKESVVGLYNPHVHRLHLQTARNQWMNKQQNHTDSQKRGLCLCFFFWTKIKKQKVERSSFVCCSFCPVTPCSWKTKPCYDLCGLVLYSSRAEDCLKTGNMFLGYLFFFCFVFFFFFILILKVILERFHRLWDLISLAALWGENGSSRAAFWLFTWN